MGAEFYRYVDDMIIIVPNPQHYKEVLQALQTELNKLDLDLNEDKTEIYKDVTQFLDATKEDELLNKLKQTFDSVVNPILITTTDYRKIFRTSHSSSNDKWEYQIGLYQQCLKTISIYFNIPTLGRKIYGYLFNQTRCKENLMRPSELDLPSLPSDNQDDLLKQWAINFEIINNDWIEDRNKLTAIPN